MIVKLVDNTIEFPEELFNELQLENGQEIEIRADSGCLKVSVTSEADGEMPPLTPDQQLAHYIADTFTDIEEMVAMMAAIVDIKSKIPAGDTQMVQEIGERLEEILLRAREERMTDETC